MGVKNVVDFGWQIVCRFSPGKKGFKFVTENFTTFFTARKDTLRSEIITQLIPQKLSRAMITRISRNPARNNSSEIFWRNDKMAIAQIDFWKHATRTVRKQRATAKLRNPPENNSPRVVSRNQLRRFRAIPRKRIPQYFFHARNVFWMESICHLEVTLGASSVWANCANRLCFMGGVCGFTCVIMTHRFLHPAARSATFSKKCRRERNGTPPKFC